MQYTKSYLSIIGGFTFFSKTPTFSPALADGTERLNTWISDTELFMSRPWPSICTACPFFITPEFERCNQDQDKWERQNKQTKKADFDKTGLCFPGTSLRKIYPLKPRAAEAVYF